MYIKKSTEQKSTRLQKISIFGVVLVVITLSFWMMNKPSGAEKIAKNQI
jgi:hypothetical protein